MPSLRAKTDPEQAPQDPGLQGPVDKSLRQVGHNNTNEHWHASPLKARWRIYIYIYLYLYICLHVIFAYNILFARLVLPIAHTGVAPYSEDGGFCRRAKVASFDVVSSAMESEDSGRG